MKKTVLLRPKTLFLVLSITIMVIFLLLRFIFPSQSSEQNSLTAPVVKANIEDTVLASGVLQAKTQVDVGAQVSGQLKKLKVQLGERVAQGQLLAEIDPILQQNDVRSAEARLKDTLAQQQTKEALLLQAELNFKRQQKMMRSAATSVEDLENAQTALTTAKADVISARSQVLQTRIQLDTAKASLNYTQITAPIAGEVVAIVTKQGQTVVATQTPPVILKLAEMDTMTVRTQISEADVIRIEPGQKVYFTILGAPEKRFYATLKAIEPAPDSILTDSNNNKTNNNTTTAVYYNALFDIPNIDRLLRIGMTAQVSIILNEVQQALTIPRAALGERQGKQQYDVRVLGSNGVIEKRQINVGISDSINVQVTKGLQAGEKVLLGGNMVVRE